MSNENETSEVDPKQLEQMIMTVLVSRQDKFLFMLKDIIAMRDGLLTTENEAFHEDVNKQFKERAFSIMCNAITYNLACSPEAVYSVLENLNLDTYLKVGT